jgi:hypothetical protein
MNIYKKSQSRQAPPLPEIPASPPAAPAANTPVKSGRPAPAPPNSPPGAGSRPAPYFSSLKIELSRFKTISTNFGSDFNNNVSKYTRSVFLEEKEINEPNKVFSTTVKKIHNYLYFLENFRNTDNSNDLNLLINNYNVIQNAIANKEIQSKNNEITDSLKFINDNLPKLVDSVKELDSFKSLSKLNENSKSIKLNVSSKIDQNKFNQNKDKQYSITVPFQDGQNKTISWTINDLKDKKSFQECLIKSGLSNKLVTNDAVLKIVLDHIEQFYKNTGAQ